MLSVKHITLSFYLQAISILTHKSASWRREKELENLETPFTALLPLIQAPSTSEGKPLHPSLPPFFSLFPSDQPRLNHELHVTDLHLELKTHTLSSRFEKPYHRFATSKPLICHSLSLYPSNRFTLPFSLCLSISINTIIPQSHLNPLGSKYWCFYTSLVIMWCFV